MIQGKAIRLGNHVDTDVIIAAKYCTSIDPQFLGAHSLETSELPESKRFFHGAILVAGNNFGCGSAREHAALAIRGAGVVAVIARSLSRTFFRNAINIALPVFELEEMEEIQEKDELEIDLTAGLLHNRTSHLHYTFTPYPEVIRSILEAGGMIEFARRRLAEKQKKETKSPPK